MNQTNLPDRPISPIFRWILMGIGIVSFVVIGGQGIGQADDKRYVEGYPRIQDSQSTFSSVVSIGAVSSLSIDSVNPSTPATETSKDSSSVVSTQQDMQTKSAVLKKEQVKTQMVSENVPDHAAAHQSVAKSQARR